MQDVETNSYWSIMNHEAIEGDKKGLRAGLNNPDTKLLGENSEEE
jgi:hypothetical protein